MNNRKIISIKYIPQFPLYDITVKNDHCFELWNGVVAHNSMYPTTIVGGGTGLYLSSNDIWVLGRQQDKNDKTKQIEGYDFIIRIEKSRFVQEGSKFPVSISFKEGILKWSGLLELALEGNYITKPKNGQYALVDRETGEVSTNIMKEDEINQSDATWNHLLKETDFPDYIENKFKLSTDSIVQYDKKVVDED